MTHSPVIAAAKALAEKYYPAWPTHGGLHPWIIPALCEALSATLPSEEAMKPTETHDPDCFLSGGDDGRFPCICAKKRTPKPEPTEDHLRRACEELGFEYQYFRDGYGKAHHYAVRTVARLLAERDAMQPMPSETNVGNITWRGEEWVPLEAYREAMAGWKAAGAERDAMEARVEGWQPINTRPTNGMEALVGVWVDYEGKRIWSSWTTLFDGGPLGNDGINGDEPTHWMPLPAGPEPTPTSGTTDPDLVLADQLAAKFESRMVTPYPPARLEALKEMALEALKLKGQAHDQ